MSVDRIAMNDTLDGPSGPKKDQDLLWFTSFGFRVSNGKLEPVNREAAVAFTNHINELLEKRETDSGPK